jgi:hypothetical protein
LNIHDRFLIIINQRLTTSTPHHFPTKEDYLE